MASAFAAQLRTIAANSTHELDLRARRTAHAESLIFDREVAVKQDWDTLWAICSEGFQELCQLDPRLEEYGRNLFSPQSKDQDREQLNKSENAALDTVIERCLRSLGRWVSVRPGVKSVEWLVRRFRVHSHNASALLATFLSSHEVPVWRNVLRLVEEGSKGGIVPPEWKFLGPYLKTAAIVPRHAIVYSATNNDGFFTVLNGYVIRCCQEGSSWPQLMRFWSSIAVEAVVGRMRQARSGRKEVQRQRTEDVLLKIVPLLDDGFAVRDCPELTMACYTIAIVLAGSADLSDTILDGLMEAVVHTILYGEMDAKQVMICLTILVSRKQDVSVSRGVLAVVMKAEHIGSLLHEVNDRYPATVLATALIRASLTGMKPKNYAARTIFLESLLRTGSTFAPHAAVRGWVELLVQKVQTLDSADAAFSAVRARLIESLQQLNESDNYAPIFAELAGQAADGATTDLENILGSTLPRIEAPAATDGDVMDIDVPEVVNDPAHTALAALPERTADTHSFLAVFDPTLGSQLADAFGLSCRHATTLQEFESLAIWQTQTQGSPLFVTFLLRIACGPRIAQHRAAALKMVAKSIQSQVDLDAQAILPYVLVCLADPAQNVRKAAAELVLAVEKAAPKSLVQGEDCRQFGKDDLYQHDALDKVSWISSNQLTKLVRQALMPVLEECVLDESHISKALQSALNGSSTPGRLSSQTESIELKKALRHSLFDLITSHAVATPLIKVKISIIAMLDNVGKVGQTTKSKALAPVLRSWTALSAEQAEKAAQAESLSMNEVDSLMVQIVSTHEKDAVGHVLGMLADEETTPRGDLVAAFFNRIIQLWTDLRHESQSAAANKLFELSFSNVPSLSRGARSVLQTASLPTDVLNSFLDSSCSGLAQMHEGPPKKKRRSSSGRATTPQGLSSEHDMSTARLTLALELVDNSKPENRSELLAGLFEVLAIMRRLKQHQKTESPYLLHLCLSSVLAIVDQARNRTKPGIDLSSIRADLVTNCIRSSENPQVQSTALLLSASLAALAPDRMLHNVMPIFTSMGHNILSKDDEHSIYVINQAIDQIIPPLVRTMKKTDEAAMVRSAAGLLSSFTSAFDHIPQHRRVSFYQRLINRLNAGDFAFAIIAMLVMRKQGDDSMGIFFNSLMANFDAETQLATFSRLLSLINSIYSSQPLDADALLDINNATSVQDKHNAALALLQTSLQLLKNKSLKTQLSKLHKTEPKGVENASEGLRICLSQTLESIRDRHANGQDLADVAKECLSALLELPTIVELFNVFSGVLDDLASLNNTDLRPQALRVLASQLNGKVPRDSRTQLAAMQYLPKLEDILKSKDDESMKQAAVACIDRITEVYGRKNVESVVRAAEAVHEHGLGSDSDRLRVMSMLCLASMMEVLKEAVIPILPKILSNTFMLLDDAIDRYGAEAHNAAYALLSALVSHVPFMVSEEYLVRILELSIQSANAELPEEFNESRKETLSLLSQQVDLDNLLDGLDKAWTSGLDSWASTVVELLGVLSDAIDRASKANIIRYSDRVSNLLLLNFDRRRTRPDHVKELFTDDDITRIESKINDVAMKFIYKLNDTVFRPAFESWIDWAVKCHDLPSIEDVALEKAKVLRQTSLFNFLAHFFESLKSIVTGYASYVIEPANAILSRFADANDQSKALTTLAADADSLALYKSLLSTLRTTFTHDADAFFSSPSHFSPLSSNLISQLPLASNKALRPVVASHVAPAIVSLATAVLDTPTHHHALNKLICSLRRSESAAVRLASIQLQRALSEDDDVGEEWINNVVGNGAGGDGGMGETMVYVNEMLEDDDENVEREVRRWVHLVRERVGEDVFEV